MNPPSTKKLWTTAAAIGTLTGCLSLLATSCSDTDPVPGSTEPEPEPEPAPPVSPEVAWPTLECDPLVPGYCPVPFPSNVYTEPDDGTPTGLRVALSSETIPTGASGAVSSPVPWNKADGFSANAALMTLLPGATDAGLATPASIEDSLAADAKTVVLNAETGERVAHFAELDKSAYVKDDPLLLIRPVVRLDDATRYIVAVRGVVDETGDAVEASEEFAALRDAVVSEDETVEARRGLYEDIFERLTDAGFEREELQIAWDFTTASRESNTGWMVHMRDEALEILGDTPSYEIVSVETDFKPETIAYRIEATMKVPLYMTDPDPGGRLIFGDDGLPEPNPDTPMYDVPFVVLIPHAAIETPGALLQYGHGLLGSYGQVNSFDELANIYNYVIFGATLDGMGGDDTDLITAALASGQIDDLEGMYDRLHQGMLNYLLLMRVMRTSFAEDATYGAFIDPTERYYHGISQGGIFGGTYMALSTDVERGVLGVMGQPYNLLLNRSVDFAPFFLVMALAFPDAKDHQMLLSLVQMLWDRTEPAGYTHYLAGDTLPGTPDHSVLMRAAVGDHQVTTLGAHIMARAVGATHVDTGVRSIYGLDTASSLPSGSSYVEYEFGLPPDPLCNVPMTACEDPHSEIRKLEAARQQLDLFLRTGETQNFCPGGVCSFPELGGCTAEDATPACD